MPHAEPPSNPQDASVTNKEGSGAPVLFPPVGNFSAVVPLSEIDADSEIRSESKSRVTARAPLQFAESAEARAAARAREPDEREEATLVPSRAARTAKALRPATRRPSWPFMIAALVLSLTAGLAAGVYLIKSSVPVEIQSPASMTQEAAHEPAGASATNGSQPTEVASESRPEARPQAETSHDAAVSDVDAEAREEKTSRDLPAPKRVTTADALSGRGERSLETSHAPASEVERTPERPARKAPSSSTRTPAPTETVRTRRATPAGEPPPVRRAPERSMPVSSPPSSAKSKRVIQWP